MNRKAAGILKYLLSLVLAGALIYFALRGIDWRAFAEGLGETRWGYALLYLLAALLALVFREERWRAMMLPLNPEVRRIDAWDSANVGNVVNVVLPGAGEFVRCGYISSKRFSYDKAFGTIVSERAWDVIAVGLLFVTALALNWNTFGSFFVDNIWQPLGSRMNLSLWWIIGALAVMAAMVTLTYDLRGGEPLYGMLSDRVAVTIDGRRSELPVTTNAIGIEPTEEMTAVCEVTPVSHFFGIVEAGSDCTVEVWIANRGRGPMHIRGLQVRRGTTATLTDGTVVEAGRSVRVTVTLHVSEEAYGRVAGGLSFVVNDPARPFREIRLTAETD